MEKNLIRPPVLGTLTHKVREHDLAIRPHVAEQVRVIVVAEFVNLRVIVLWPFDKHISCFAFNERLVIWLFTVYSRILVYQNHKNQLIIYGLFCFVSFFFRIFSFSLNLFSLISIIFQPVLID